MPHKPIENGWTEIQQQEWIKACRELSKADIAVLYLVCCQVPSNMGNRTYWEAAKLPVYVDKDWLCQTLELDPRTVRRSLAKLNKLGYIESTSARVMSVRIA